MYIKVDEFSENDDIEQLRSFGVNIFSKTINTVKDLEGLEGLQFKMYICLRFDLSEVLPEDCFKIVASYKPWAVDFVGTFLPSKKLYEDLLNLKVRIVFSGIDVSCDTAPNWILGRYKDEGFIHNSFMQIDFLEDQQDAWSFLKNETPLYEDELQIQDIVKLCNENKVLANFNFSKNNIGEIVNWIKGLYGVSFNLKASSFHRHYTVEEIIDILANLTK